MCAPISQHAIQTAAYQNSTVMPGDGKPATANRIRLFFLIRSLDPGGAERQLTELVKRLDIDRFDILVATFYDGGALRSELQNLPGIRLVSLQKKGRWDVIPFVIRLARLVRAFRPEVLHGYMGVSNELCSLMARLFGGRAVWGLRMSDWEAPNYDWLCRLAVRSSVWFSPFADLIIVNSNAGKHAHIARGYRPDRMTVIHNGIDTNRFRPNPSFGQKYRREWGVSDSEFLIGLVGRLDPQKDHPTFLRAASLTLKNRPNARFVCVGNGNNEQYKHRIRLLATELGVDARLTWLPASDDISAIYNAMDLVTLCSWYGEGFPNVIGEAMSCGIPVVSTDAGDAAAIIGEEEQVVPIQRPDLLSAAWCRVMDLQPDQRDQVGSRERARIINHFDVARLAQRTVAQINSIK